MDELSIDSLLSVAIAIETNGAEYYREAAKIAPAEMRDEFLHLAKVEDEHTKQFEVMKDELAPGDKKTIHLELSNQQKKYIQCIIAHSAFIAPGDAPKLTGNETMRELLKTAIDDEKDTIVFYQCLRSAVKDDKLLEVLGLIIDEELGHIFDLANCLETL
jgi:rubrerythrin